MKNWNFKISIPLFFLFIIFMTCTIHAQQTSMYVNNWHFGTGVGMNFNAGAPINTPSSITSYEVATSYSNGDGNVLFYAGAINATTGGNGFTVWDASNATMPNGDVAIDYSSSCGLTIVPVPGNCDQYYIIAVSVLSGVDYGLRSTVVDMSLQGNGTIPSPLGDVVAGQKDILIFATDTLAEKIKVVQKGNTENYWIIARSLNYDVFYSFEVTTAGINPIPVVSTISATSWPTPTGSPIVGWLAVNRDRNVIAESNGLAPDAKIYSFNNLTGILTLEESVIPTGIFGSDIPYGIEFSPSGDVLFVSWYQGGTTSAISSFDMTVGFGSIAATRQDNVISVGGAEYGALTRGPDGKVYGSRFGSTQLTVINTPENYLAPTVVSPGYDPSPGASATGMPNITYYFHPDNFIDTLAGTDKFICQSGQVTIGATPYDSIWCNYSWEPSAMVINPSNATTQTIVLFADQQFILYTLMPCGDTIKSDTMMVYVSGATVPTIFTPNSWYCVGDNLTPIISDNGTLWYDDVALTSQVAADSFYIPSPILGISTYYVVDTTGGCISGAASIDVEFTDCPDPCATNLLTNPDFEVYSSCPTNPSELDLATGWLQIQTNSNDYFNCTYFGMPGGPTLPPITTPTTGMFYNPSGTGYVGINIKGTGFIAGESFGQQVNLYKCADYTLQFRAATDNTTPTVDNDICVYGGNVPTTPGAGCMDNYDLLACLPASNFGLTWNLHTINFTPTQDYTYIAITGSCPTTGTLPNAGYLYFDDLFLCEDLCANPPSITTTIEVTPANCGSSNGAATVDMTGCYGTYSFDWQDVGNLGVTISTDSIPLTLPGATYQVIVSDGNSCSDTSQVLITQIGGPSAPVAGIDSTYCEGDAMANMTVVGAGGTYTWYDDVLLTNVVGIGSSQAPSVGIGVTNYYVTETSGGCEGLADSVTITIVAAFDANVTTNAPICENEMLALAATPGGMGFGNYSWVGPNGPMLAQLATINIVPLGTPIAGGYYIVTITDGVCTDTDSVYVQADPVYDIVESVNACENSAYTYPDGTTSVITANESHISNLSTGAGCDSIITTDVTMVPTYSAIIAVGICAGTDYTYADGTISTNIIANESYTSTLTTIFGCDSLITEDISVTGPLAPAAGTSTTYCEGDVIVDLTATAGSGGALTWYSDAGLSIVIGSGTTLTPFNTIGTTIYFVTESDGGCESVATLVNVTINAIPPSPSAGTSTTYCANDLIADLTAIASLGGTLNWYSDAALTTLIGTGTPLTIIPPIGTTTYYVTETNGTCEGPATSIMITVNPNPSADAGLDQTILSGSSVTLTGTGGITYSWSPPNNLSCTNCFDPVASPLMTTTYILTVTDANGCTNEDFVTITITQLEADIFIPNIFSPDGNNNNDFFVIEGTGLNEFNLQIFNRWGELVFSSEDQQISWDGTQRGKELNTAVFTYMLRYTDNFGDAQILSGNVTLVK